MSGAVPWIGSNRPLPRSSSDAEGSMPIDPVSIEASSDRMSPKRLPVTITSNCFGVRTSCIAQLSTYMWLSSTSGNERASAETTSRHSCEVSSTLALSTEHTRLPRPLRALQLVVARIADGAEENRIGLLRQPQRGRRQRIAAGFVAGAADGRFLRLERQGELAQHLPRLRNDLRPDAVAGKNGE